MAEVQAIQSTPSLWKTHPKQTAACTVALVAAAALIAVSICAGGGWGQFARLSLDARLAITISGAMGGTLLLGGTSAFFKRLKDNNSYEGGPLLSDPTESRSLTRWEKSKLFNYKHRKLIGAIVVVAAVALFATATIFVRHPALYRMVGRVAYPVWMVSFVGTCFAATLGFSLIESKIQHYPFYVGEAQLLDAEKDEIRRLQKELVPGESVWGKCKNVTVYIDANRVAFYKYKAFQANHEVDPPLLSDDPRHIQLRAQQLALKALAKIQNDPKYLTIIEAYNNPIAPSEPYTSIAAYKEALKAAASIPDRATRIQELGKISLATVREPEAQTGS